MKSRIDASIPLALRHSKPTVLDETWTMINTSVPDQLSPQQSKFIDKTLKDSSNDCQLADDSFMVSKPEVVYGECSSSDSEDASIPNSTITTSRYGGNFEQDAQFSLLMKDWKSKN